MPRANTSVTLDHPDPQILHILAILKAASLVAVAGIASVVLGASLLEPLGSVLPPHWTQTTAAPAMCALLGTFSLILSRSGRSPRSSLAGQALAVAVILAAALEAFHFFTTSDPAIRADHSIPQAAFAYLLLGMLMLCLRVQRPGLTQCVDALTTVTCILVMVFFFSYTLGTLGMLEVPNVSHYTRISGPTIACLTLLSFVAFNRRAEYGMFGVLYNAGIAGKTARLAAPFALGLPVLRSIGRGYIHTEYVTALTSFVAFCLLLILCVRISNLEREVRNLSLCDELTGLYNRRGFNVLAQQAYLLARRSGETFSVLFLDVDNLKQINDLHGHDSGSALLQEMAAVLRRTFRETDVIGRVGGDEFVIAGKADPDELASAVKRLESFAAEINQAGDRRYSLRFSLGHVTTDHMIAHSLDDLIQHADQIMYESKRLKKTTPPTHLISRIHTAQI